MSCLAYDLNISQPMADKKCCTKIVFFSEKKVSWPYDILCPADKLTVLIYDNSLIVLDPVTA